MAGQLIYTSAPQGLVPGQSGYCTVARDAELRDTLVRSLEQLSVFHHAAGAGQDQVVSTYRILDVRGAKYHVVSRIQDAGLDFTNRTNHVAHHLIFEPHELANLPSPPLLLRDWNGWRKDWSEAPRWLGAADWGNLAQVPRAASLPAKTWASVTGDAGTAARLLEREFANGAFLLAESAEQFVSLFAESLQLLALKDRSRVGLWEYTFTTRLQPEDNPNDFRWRGCQTDSPAYQTSVRKGASFTPVKTFKAPASDYASYARTGQLPAPQIKFPMRNAGTTPGPGPVGAPLKMAPGPVPLRGWDSSSASFEQEPDETEKAGKSRSFGALVVGLGGVLALGAVGVMMWLHSQKTPNLNSGESGTTNDTASPTNSTPQHQIIAPHEPASALPPSHPAADPNDKYIQKLPDFTTYLAGASAEDGGIKVDAVADLGRTCDQLKTNSSGNEMAAILECRHRSTAPLVPDDSDSAKAPLSFVENNLHSDVFSFDGWRSLTLPSDHIYVIDFISLKKTFDHFRIVSFPTEAGNEPLKIPTSVLQANQENLRDSFKPVFAERIAKIKCYGDGFLQLRPCVNTDGTMKDMVDSLKLMDSPAAPAKGNELNFVKIRNSLRDQTNQIAQKINDNQSKIEGLKNEILDLEKIVKDRVKDSRKAPEDENKQNALSASRSDLEKKKTDNDKCIKYDKALKNTLATYNQCLALIPESLDDPKLDHVDLDFIPGARSKASERVQLIQFVKNAEAP